MNDSDYTEMKRRLMEDTDFMEFVRLSFKDSLESCLSLKVHIETARRRCSSCGKVMYLRVSKQDGGFFWGCSGYPFCRGIEQASAVDIADFAKDYPEQWSALKAKSDMYIEAMNMNEGVDSDSSSMHEVVVPKNQPDRRKKKKSTQ